MSIIEHYNFFQTVILNICFHHRVVALPEKAPAIDWAFYQQKITTPGFVDSFRKHYETLQVPYPVDNVSSQIDAQQKDAVS